MIEGDSSAIGSNGGGPSDVPADPSSVPAVGERRGAWNRFRRYLGRHPVLLLVLLSPGIPEYLSGSSPLNLLVESPLFFGMFLAANLALYGPGVLLIREARVRWHKGWGTVLVLAAAYAVLEEGIALSTLFDPRASVVGGLGAYGHFAGVSWVWLVGVMMVHVLFSISLPILLLDLAVPATRERPLLGRRGIGVAVGLLGLDVILLATVVDRFLGFWMGIPLLVASLAAIGGLVVLARLLPADAGAPPTARPTAPPAVFAALGAGVFLGVLLIQSFNDSLGTPALLTVAELIGFLAAVGLILREIVGRHGNERALVAFAAGAIVDIAVIGLIEGRPIPLVIGPDLLAVAFFVYLYRHASASASVGALPAPGALASAP